MPAPYDLTPAAKADIRGIWLYTVETWGGEQADRYLAALDTMCRKIASGNAVSRTFSNTYPQVRVTRCERHYIFSLFPEGKRPLVIAILHEKMDVLTRLQRRLQV